MTHPQQPVLTKPDSGNVFVHSASTVTASGSTVVSGVGSKELTLVVNITVTPTGTTPTLTYTLQEVDPGDLTAVFGPTASTSAINAIGVHTVSLGATTGGAVKISWAITGAGASFTGVYATASTKVGTASNASGAIAITGTVTATNASTGTNNAAAPASSTQVGGTDGTNLQAARVFDADTGGGTQYVLGVGLRKAASGGSVEAGTSTDPLRIDPTGTTTQPISAVSLPLPTGAATETTLGTRLADATFTGRINTLGQKTMANSTPVVLSSDQTVIPVSDNGGSLTVDSAQLPAALVGGRLDENVGAWLGSTAPTVGSKTSANSVPVVIASDQAAVAVSAASLPLPTGAATSANQTTLGSQTSKINDGTNTATVKAASTAAVAGDTALVVAISPNNPIVASNPSVGSNNAAIPTSSTQVGGSDGTNLQVARVFDADTGGGTQYVLGTVLRKSASGGSVEAGTSADPLRVDPTGTTTQPISAASLPLPTGAATETTLGTRLADATFTGRINTLGQKTSANSTPVVLSSDQSAIPITDNAGSLTVDSAQLPAALVGARLDVNNGAWLGSTAPTVGSKTSANSIPVVIASDQAAVAVSGTVTANIGTTNGLALDATLTGNNQRTRLTDGTNLAAVKAASTAAVAGDPALVVAVSPNNTVAITDNGGSLTVDGTVAVSNSFALDATLTGGTQKAIARGGAKGSTVAADVTSTASGANHQAIDVAIYDASGNQITTFGGGTQFADGAARGSATGTLIMVDDGTLIQSASGDSSGRQNVNSRVTDGTNTAAVKAAMTAAVAADPALVVALSPNVNGIKADADSLSVTLSSDLAELNLTKITPSTQRGVPNLGLGYGSYLKIPRAGLFGHTTPLSSTLLGLDQADNNSFVNTWFWSQSTSGMTVSMSSVRIMRLNSTNTLTSGSYAIVTSNMHYPMNTQGPIALCISGALDGVPPTNGRVDLGFGSPSGATASITNSIYFRISNGVLSYGVHDGTNDNVTVTGITYTVGTPLEFNIFVDGAGTEVRFIVKATTTGDIVLDAVKNVVNGAGAGTGSLQSKLPVFVRVYNSAATASAQRFHVSECSVTGLENSLNKSYGEQRASIGKHAFIHPQTFTQTLQLAAGAAPSAITPNNTGSTAYTVMGGEFLITHTAASENFLGVFAYTVPSPFSLYITEVYVPNYVVTTAFGATISIHSWALMVNASSTNPSSATGFRVPIGNFSAGASAGVGTVFNGQPIQYKFETPLVIQPGKLLLVMYKVISGAASGAFRGQIMLSGYHD